MPSLAELSNLMKVRVPSVDDTGDTPWSLSDADLPGHTAPVHGQTRAVMGVPSFYDEDVRGWRPINPDPAPAPQNLEPDQLIRAAKQTLSDTEPTSRMLNNASLAAKSSEPLRSEDAPGAVTHMLADNPGLLRLGGGLVGSFGGPIGIGVGTGLGAMFSRMGEQGMNPRHGALGPDTAASGLEGGLAGLAAAVPEGVVHVAGKIMGVPTRLLGLGKLLGKAAPAEEAGAASTLPEGLTPTAQSARRAAGGAPWKSVSSEVSYRMPEPMGGPAPGEAMPFTRQGYSSTMEGDVQPWRTNASGYSSAPVGPAPGEAIPGVVGNLEPEVPEAATKWMAHAKASGLSEDDPMVQNIYKGIVDSARKSTVTPPSGSMTSPAEFEASMAASRARNAPPETLEAWRQRTTPNLERYDPRADAYARSYRMGESRLTEPGGIPSGGVEVEQPSMQPPVEPDPANLQRLGRAESRLRNPDSSTTGGLRVPKVSPPEDVQPTPSNLITRLRDLPANAQADVTTAARNNLTEGGFKVPPSARGLVRDSSKQPDLKAVVEDLKQGYQGKPSGYTPPKHYPKTSRSAQIESNRWENASKADYERANDNPQEVGRLRKLISSKLDRKP
jgi:hypothetical protein